MTINHLCDNNGVCVFVRQLRLAHILFCEANMKYEREELDKINLHTLYRYLTKI